MIWQGDQGWKDIARRSATLGGALALHLVVFGVVLSKAKEPIMTQDGYAVSVSLVSGLPGPVGAHGSTRSASLEALTQRLAQNDTGAAPEQPTQSSPTRLRDLMDNQHASGVATNSASASGGARSGVASDPYARASVAYDGEDQSKAARLTNRARRCLEAPFRGGPVRITVMIDSDGNLVGRPRQPQISPRRQEEALAVRAIQACAPYSTSGTPGAPRSYEVELG